jgi:predicted MFS family arabinose efflux permease
MILIGLVATAVCFFSFGLARGMAQLLVAALAGGLGNAAVLGPAIAVAGTTFAGAKLRRALGWTTACMAGSAVVGVPLLTAAGSAVGWRWAFIAAGLVVIGIASLAVAWLPRPARSAAGDARPAPLLAAYRPLLRHGPTLRVYAISMLRAICWFGMLTYFGAFLGQELRLTTGQVGIAYMLGGGGYFLGSLVAGGPLGEVAPRLLLIAGNLALALVMGLAYAELLGPLGTVAMLPLAGFAGALGWIAVAALLTTGSPAGAGTTMTLHGSLFNLGAAAGGAIGGLLLGIAGYGALASGLPLFGLAAAALAWGEKRG